eukprot:3761728-Rhodomonas_salina.2
MYCQKVQKTQRSVTGRYLCGIRWRELQYKMLRPYRGVQWKPSCSYNLRNRVHLYQLESTEYAARTDRTQAA